MRFKDRSDAGKKLAENLEKYNSGEDTVVLALPRGGVPVAYEVAKYLNAPMDLVMTRKVGHPRNPEYAICAVSENGNRICNEVEASAVDDKWLREESKKQIEEAKRRRKLYVRDSKEKIKGKTVILVDDGVATGLSLRLAIDEVKKQNPKKLIVAVPVSPRETAVDLRRKVDEFVADQIPKVYAGAVGAYYNEFNQVTDDEVIKLINKLKDNGR